MRLTWALAAALCALALVPWAAADAEVTVIHAGHLIAEPGKAPADNQSVVIENGRITAVRDGFVPGDKVIDLRDAWVMPGLIDMHTHIYAVLDLTRPAAPQLAQYTLAPPEETVLGMLPRARDLLMNGFTTIRSLGDQSFTQYALRDAIAAGYAPGPRMIVAEAQIAIASGDLDPSTFDVRPEAEPLVRNRGFCSGVEDCIRVVREEVRRGADVIKFRQSGMPFLTPGVVMAERPEEVRAIIETAHQLGRKVAVHVPLPGPFMHLAIEAEADTIEHGPLDDRAIELMRTRKTCYVPTLAALAMLPSLQQKGVEYLGRAYRAGVPICYGTDLGIVKIEDMSAEFAVMARAGMPPPEILRAATLNAASALGRSDSLGSIAPGKIADIIAMREDPLSHIDRLGASGAASFVMKEGTVFKDVGGPR